MKKFIELIFIITVFFVFLPKSYAENFYIEKYDVDIAVNKNKQVSITENIDANFTKASHGIIREIPHNHASVTGIYVFGDKFKTNDKPTELSIKIGDPYYKIEGKKHYKIKYDYNYHDNKNEFYHNIIGTEWNVPINKVTFKITMPENINPEEAGLSIGKKGKKGFEGGAHFTINGKVITGETERGLKEREGITFRTHVPEGYFNKYSDKRTSAIIKIVLLLTFISFFIWFICGKEDKVIPVVNFKLPKEIDNVLEAELFYKEEISDTGLAALLLEFANKGYIKINNTKYSFSITKLKDIKKENRVEQMFMEALFGKRTSVSQKQLKTVSHLYKGCYEIYGHFNSNREKILYNKISVNKFLRFIMNTCVMGIVFCLLAFASGFCIEPYRKEDDYTAAISSLLFLKFFYINWNILLTFLAVFCILYLFLFAALSGYTSTEYISQILLCSLCTVATYICTINLPKRTKTVNRIRGELEGLKKYIETAEKHELELMFERNPQEFYDVLPYAYIFGLSDLWLGKIKEFLKPEIEPYDVRYLDTFTNSWINLSHPSYDNGGLEYYENSESSYSGSGHSYSSSSGCGGHSGGGGGGGGGSSW